MFCPHCGAGVREGAKFCPACGQAIAAANAAQPGRAQQPAAAQSNQPSYDATVIGQRGAAPAPGVQMPQATPSARQFSPSAGAAPSQPMAAPGVNGTPSGATPINVQPITADPLVKEMVSPRNIQAIFASAGFGLLAAIVFSIFPAIAFTQMTSASEESGMSLFNGLSSSYNPFGEFVGVDGPNFFHYLLLNVAFGISGSVAPQAAEAGSTSAEAAVSIPLGLTGIALIIGAAFGAYLLARKGAIRFKWAGIISSALSGVVAAAVFTLIAAIFRAPLGVGDELRGYFSAGTFRTFLMMFLLTFLGAGFGYMLAQYAPDSTNVFTAAWRWHHRTRGFVRSFIEVVNLQIALITIMGIVILLIATFKTNTGQLILFFPIMALMLGTWLFVISTFGAITLSIPSQLPINVSLFGKKLPIDAIMKPWIVWVLFLVILVLLFYVALRASARNLYDPAFKGWGHSWKMPVAVMVFWLIAGILFCTVTLSYSDDSSKGAVTIGPALWYFLVMGIWAYLVEAVANSFGPSVIMSMQGVWKLFAGGTVQPTPQEVVDYVAGCNGRWFKKYPSSGVPSASALAAAQAAKEQAAKVRAAAQAQAAAAQAQFAANGPQSAAVPPIPGAAPAAQPAYGQQPQYGAAPAAPAPAAPQYGAQPGYGAPAAPAAPASQQPQQYGQQGGPSLPLPPRQ
ncbi:zinc-ribbon domain-containing protein [Bifidobacterium stellenboschense]|uniref:Heme utilization protein n=1 Tax=Bifidobacterium stellenboschense TaxID=762211 RepID=A0A087DN34_9BIFI|nr:zinc-ribbon domain-containing protein [Bifidobacterium stellenboschense]KFI96934.1 heme utilization protein [Bifidobacterium stellenboschense]